MKLYSIVGAAALFALVGAMTTNSAEAATVVSEGTSATFAFEVQDPTTLTGLTYNCSPLCTGDADPDNWLASDASFGLHFGTTMAGSEFGTAYAYNPFGMPIDNMGTSFLTSPGNSSSTSLPIPGLSTLLVTAFFVDDNFGIGSLVLRADDGTQFIGSEVAPVPLPAALPLFMAALAGMGLIGWHRKRALA